MRLNFEDDTKLLPLRFSGGGWGFKNYLQVKTVFLEKP
jgi:hypothetical protein